jgi:hypothetical protein
LGSFFGGVLNVGAAVLALSESFSLVSSAIVIKFLGMTFGFVEFIKGVDVEDVLVLQGFVIICLCPT